MSDELELDPYGALIEVPSTAQHWSVGPLPPAQRMQTPQVTSEDPKAEYPTLTLSESLSPTVATVSADIPPLKHESPSLSAESEPDMAFLQKLAVKREHEQQTYEKRLQRQRMRKGIALALVASATAGIGLLIQRADHAHNAAPPVAPVAIASVAHLPVVHHTLVRHTTRAQHVHARPMQHHLNKPHHAKHIQHARHDPAIINIAPRPIVHAQQPMITTSPAPVRISAPKSIPIPHIVEHAPDIVRFDAMPEHIYAGQYATICVRTMNAVDARISGVPRHIQLDPWSLNCMVVSPRKTTTYSVWARNHHGAHIRESLTLVVRPKLNFGFDTLARPNTHQGR